MNKDSPLLAPPEGVSEDDRSAAVARLHDLLSGGTLSFECFSAVLDQVFAAPSHAELEVAMLTLPGLTQLTPPSRRLTKPLTLRAADGGLHLGPGWQLAADTRVTTGCGASRLDLTTASWDDHRVDLRLETWGSIEILVREGVAVQIVRGSGRVHLESLSTPVPGGPILRVSTSGPTGAIRIRHPEKRLGGPFGRWRRRRTTGRRACR